MSTPTSNCRCPAMTTPSAWVTRFAPLIPKTAPVLDVACGEGRHSAWFLLQGWSVLSVDLDVSALEPLLGTPGLTVEARDLEAEPWPWPAESFAGIVVTNYLFRDHFMHYWESLIPGGILIMETFLRANKAIWGRPQRESHSLEENELIRWVPQQARIVAFEQGLTQRDLAVARLVIAKPSAVEPLVYPLSAG